MRARREKSEPESPAAPSAPVERVVTVQVWGRGRASDAIVKAFVSENSRGRTVKRTAAEWGAALLAFRQAPR